MTPVTPDVCPPYIARRKGPSVAAGGPAANCPACPTNGVGTGASGGCGYASQSKFPNIYDPAPQNQPNSSPAPVCTPIYS